MINSNLIRLIEKESILRFAEKGEKIRLAYRLNQDFGNPEYCGCFYGETPIKVKVKNRTCLRRFGKKYLVNIAEIERTETGETQRILRLIDSKGNNADFSKFKKRIIKFRVC